jgi:cytochrome c551/c552
LTCCGLFRNGNLVIMAGLAFFDPLLGKGCYHRPLKRVIFRDRLPEWKNHATDTMRLTAVIVLVALSLLASLVVWNYFTGQSRSDASVSVTPILATGHPQAAIYLAESKGCTACHSLDGSIGIGPSWKGSYGSTRTFADGSMLQVDEAYLRESILQPGARVVAGYQNVMVAPALSEHEVASLVELIRRMTPEFVQ